MADEAMSRAVAYIREAIAVADEERRQAIRERDLAIERINRCKEQIARYRRDLGDLESTKL